MNVRDWDLVHCYVKNLIHTIYREIRHIGPASDKHAFCKIPAGSPFTKGALRCRDHRKILKAPNIEFLKRASVPEILDHYCCLTGLELEDLQRIFGEYQWSPSYGGARWAHIVRLTRQLLCTVDQEDLDEARAICAEIQRVEHNSGRLVPTRNEWASGSTWLRQKWPLWCGD